MSVYLVTRGDGSVPVYRQIREMLARDIREFYKAGNALPAEKELAQRFGVNRHTLRRAIDDLVADGLVERCHGKGTFVLDSPADYLLGSVTRFTETFESLGKTTSSRILRKFIIPASGSVATRLHLTENDSVVWIESLRLADDRPICVISHFLPQRLFPELLDEYLGGSLHEHLESQYQFKLRRIESLVSAMLPQGDDATLLGMAQHQPVLRVKSVNVDERDETPIEYALTRFCADRIQLRINL